MTSRAEGVAPSRAVPEEHGGRAAVRAWLFATAFLVFAIVVVGGATRLTESGLAITEWEVVTGILPPLTEAQWQAEFEKYRQIPQYREINRGMSLAAFQTIYLWEWGHRLLGRVIGLVFLAGLATFWALGRLTRPLAWKLLGIGALIGLQGAIGWWMVTSGLVDRVAVAPYRLAVHLTLACIIFALLMWVAWSLKPRPFRVEVPRTLARSATILIALIFFQIFLGALVAGTRAGHVYQTWPLIDGGLWPSGMFVMSPWWKNLFENTGFVQFAHRMTAYAILAFALWHVVEAGARVADPEVRRRAVMLAAALLVQAAIGIATLLTGMRLEVALAHQAWIVPVIALALRHRFLMAVPRREPFLRQAASA